MAAPLHARLSAGVFALAGGYPYDRRSERSVMSTRCDRDRLHFVAPSRPGARRVERAGLTALAGRAPGLALGVGGDGVTGGARLLGARRGDRGCGRGTLPRGLR